MRAYLLLALWQVSVCLRSESEYFQKASRPLIIAHRGACGHLPEHSLAAYSTGVFMHSDYIETDVVFTQDNQMVCTHQPWLSNTTDVAEHPRFASRRRTVEWNGHLVDDWFTFDFTLQELRSLRLKQTWAGRNQLLNGFFQMPTLEEAVQLVLSLNAKRVSPVGIYIEMKCPSCHRALGFYPREELALLLTRFHLDTQNNSAPRAPVIIQNFEQSFLKEYALISDLPRVQLIERNQITDIDLADVNTFAHGIGPHLDDIFSSYAPLKAKPVLLQAKKLGLQVHVYGVFDDKLPKEYQHAGQLYEELGKEVEGVFTEYPEAAHSNYA